MGLHTAAIISLLFGILSLLPARNFPVIGLREGSWIRKHKHEVTLKGGMLSARIFEKNKEAYELPVGSSLNFLK